MVSEGKESITGEEALTQVARSGTRGHIFHCRTKQRVNRKWGRAVSSQSLSPLSSSDSASLPQCHSLGTSVQISEPVWAVLLHTTVVLRPQQNMSSESGAWHSDLSATSCVTSFLPLARGCFSLGYFRVQWVPDLICRGTGFDSQHIYGRSQLSCYSSSRRADALLLASAGTALMWCTYMKQSTHTY